MTAHLPYVSSLPNSLRTRFGAESSLIGPPDRDAPLDSTAVKIGTRTQVRNFSIPLLPLRSMRLVSRPNGFNLLGSRPFALPRPLATASHIVPPSFPHALSYSYSVSIVPSCSSLPSPPPLLCLPRVALRPASGLAPSSARSILSRPFSYTSCRHYAKSRKMPPKKTVQEEKIPLGRPGNSLKSGIVSSREPLPPKPSTDPIARSASQTLANPLYSRPSPNARSGTLLYALDPSSAYTCA